MAAGMILTGDACGRCYCLGALRREGALHLARMIIVYTVSGGRVSTVSIQAARFSGSASGVSLIMLDFSGSFLNPVFSGSGSWLKKTPLVRRSRRFLRTRLMLRVR